MKKSNQDDLFEDDGVGNDLPAAVNDIIMTLPGVAVTMMDLAANDIDDDALDVTRVIQPLFGSASLEPDGSVTYTPKAGFQGFDTFYYVAEDPDGAVTLGVAGVRVIYVNFAPIAEDDFASAALDEVRIDVLANDMDPEDDMLSIESFTQPEFGTVISNHDGTLSYVPRLSFTRWDEFTYTVGDSVGNSGTGTVFITRAPMDGTPFEVLLGVDEMGGTAGAPGEVVVSLEGAFHRITDATRAVTGTLDLGNGAVLALDTILMREGDTDFNGVVNDLDLLKVWQDQGRTAADASPGSDVNGDSVVDQIDLAMVQENYFGAASEEELAVHHYVLSAEGVFALGGEYEMTLTLSVEGGLRFEQVFELNVPEVESQSAPAVVPREVVSEGTPSVPSSGGSSEPAVSFEEVEFVEEAALLHKIVIEDAAATAIQWVTPTEAEVSISAVLRYFGDAAVEPQVEVEVTSGEAGSPGVQLDLLPMGDANYDGLVNDLDLLAVWQDQGRAAGRSVPGSDIDGDGDVDETDLTLVQANFLSAPQTDGVAMQRYLLRIAGIFAFEGEYEFTVSVNDGQGLRVQRVFQLAVPTRGSGGLPATQLEILASGGNSLGEPRSGLNQLEVRFSENVPLLDIGSVRMTGRDGSLIRNSAFFFDEGNFTGVWSFERPLAEGLYRLAIDFDGDGEADEGFEFVLLNDTMLVESLGSTLSS